MAATADLRGLRFVILLLENTAARHPYTLTVTKKVLLCQ